jgi:hypothetical protein
MPLEESLLERIKRQSAELSSKRKRESRKGKNRITTRKTKNRLQNIIVNIRQTTSNLLQHIRTIIG